MKCYFRLNFLSVWLYLCVIFLLWVSSPTSPVPFLGWFCLVLSCSFSSYGNWVCDFRLWSLCFLSYSLSCLGHWVYVCEHLLVFRLGMCVERGFCLLSLWFSQWLAYMTLPVSQVRFPKSSVVCTCFFLQTSLSHQCSAPYGFLCWDLKAVTNEPSFFDLVMLKFELRKIISKLF